MSTYYMKNSAKRYAYEKSMFETITPVNRQERGNKVSNTIEDAKSHLRVALSQVHPQDDEIIVGHIRDALRLLEEGTIHPKHPGEATSGER
jgi:hypothetical protein